MFSLKHHSHCLMSYDVRLLDKLRCHFSNGDIVVKVAAGATEDDVGSGEDSM